MLYNGHPMGCTCPSCEPGLSDGMAYETVSLAAGTPRLSLFARRNPNIEHYQQLLDDMGYGHLLAPQGIDGEMGDNTVAAIKKFQRDYGLTVTGEFDVHTAQKLDTLAAQKGGGAGLPGLQFDAQKIGAGAASLIPQIKEGIPWLFGKKDEKPLPDFTPTATTTGPDYTVPIIVGVVALVAVIGLGAVMMSGGGEE